MTALIPLDTVIDVLRTHIPGSRLYWFDLSRCLGCGWEAPDLETGHKGHLIEVLTALANNATLNGEPK